MGCGASGNTSRVREPTLNKKPPLPSIDTQSQSKTKTSSAKSNESTDSGIDDSEPAKKTIPVPSKIPLPVENLHIEHHQKSRLGHGETFDIIAEPRPARLAPLKHVPKFLMTNKETPTVDTDLQAKLAAKQERASRKRQEIEEARRQASSRIGHRATITTKTKPSSQPIPTVEPLPSITQREERHQQLTTLRDQLRHSSSNNSLYEPMHTPRTPRPDSVTSGMTDIANLTPRRGGFVLGATTASNFKPIYD